MQGSLGRSSPPSTLRGPSQAPAAVETCCCSVYRVPVMSYRLVSMPCGKRHQSINRMPSMQPIINSIINAKHDHRWSIVLVCAERVKTRASQPNVCARDLMSPIRRQPRHGSTSIPRKQNNFSSIDVITRSTGDGPCSHV